MMGFPASFILLYLTMLLYVSRAQLQLLCNVTQACRACGTGTFRREVECKPTGYIEGLTCVVANSSSQQPHTVLKDLAADHANLKPGAVVFAQQSCQSVADWSVASFEVIMVAALLAAYFVVLRKKRQLQRLSAG